MKGMVAVITGGTRGIGRAVVSDFLKKGYRVAFMYRSRTDLADEIKIEAVKYNSEVLAYQLDISATEAVNQTITQIYNTWGRIDVLVNNAGITRDKSLAGMNFNEWDDVMKVNLYGLFNVSRRCIFYMLKQRFGRVINVSSISGITGIKGQVNYSCSKAAMIGFTKALAKEVAKYGISVNCIAPGGVDTDMVNSLNEAEKSKLFDDIPMGRLCRPNEVAMLIGYLADKELCPEYLTGTVITLDGGLGL